MLLQPCPKGGGEQIMEALIVHLSVSWYELSISISGNLGPICPQCLSNSSKLRKVVWACFYPFLAFFNVRCTFSSLAAQSFIFQLLYSMFQ